MTDRPRAHLRHQQAWLGDLATTQAPEVVVLVSDGQITACIPPRRGDVDVGVLYQAAATVRLDEILVRQLDIVACEPLHRGRAGAGRALGSTAALSCTLPSAEAAGVDFACATELPLILIRFSR